MKSIDLAETHAWRLPLCINGDELLFVSIIWSSNIREKCSDTFEDLLIEDISQIKLLFRFRIYKSVYN